MIPLQENFKSITRVYLSLLLLSGFVRSWKILGSKYVWKYERQMTEIHENTTHIDYICDKNTPNS